jgi:ABC-type nitrate/sulfonate/bicarbonate transport system ATPase subunit
MQASDAPVVDIDLRSFSKNGTAILGQIKITLSRAETLALVGPSGIGKTSLLRIIAGIEKGFEGDRRVKGKIAMVFQEPTLLPWRTVRDNITIPTGVDARTAEDALADVGLAGRGSDYPGQLSLGQQRRLSLARAFAVKPTLLLLDEPFVSLDPALADEMIALFIKLREAHQVASIFVTHVVNEAERMASRTIRLAGSPARLAI